MREKSSRREGERERREGERMGEGRKRGPSPGRGDAEIRLSPRSSGMQTDRERWVGKERSRPSPPDPGQEPAGPCECAGWTLPAHKARLAARHNESQMSEHWAGVRPPRGPAPAADESRSSGWMRVLEQGRPGYPPSSGRKGLPCLQFPRQERPPPLAFPRRFILGQI